MARRPLVALDCDGELSDFLAGALDAIYEVTGRRYYSQEVSTWSPWLQFGLQPNQVHDVFEIITTPGFCESLPLMPGAQEGFERLYEKADVVIVTAPWATSPTWTFERQRWLERHFALSPSEVIHTSAKHFVSADFFVDDHALNVRRWQETHAGIGLLWSQPHNRNINDLPRVAGWDELIQLVEDQSKGIAAA